MEPLPDHCLWQVYLHLGEDGGEGARAAAALSQEGLGSSGLPHHPP